MSNMIVLALAVVGGGYLAYMVGGHGVPWVWGKVKALFRHAEEDVVALEERVKALEAHVATPAATAHPPAPSVPPAAM